LVTAASTCSCVSWAKDKSALRRPAWVIHEGVGLVKYLVAGGIGVFVCCWAGDGRVGVGLWVNQPVAGVLRLRRRERWLWCVAVFTVFRDFHAGGQAEGSAAGHPSARRVGAW
jgi:hypothetical protein